MNEGFGKDFYRKGNSVKSLGRFTEPPDSDKLKNCCPHPLPENHLLLHITEPGVGGVVYPLVRPKCYEKASVHSKKTCEIFWMAMLIPRGDIAATTLQNGVVLRRTTSVIHVVGLWCTNRALLNGGLVAPCRAILRYYRCDTPYRAILFKGG